MPLSEEDFADEGDNILFRAIKIKDWKKVADLLESPEAATLVKELDVYENTPLHAAIGYQTSDDLILKLLRLYPEATRFHGANEWLPLHLAAMWGSSREIVKELIQEHPEGLDDRGEGGIKGRTPRHFKDRFPQNRDLLMRSTEDWKEIIKTTISESN